MWRAETGGLRVEIMGVTLRDGGRNKEANSKRRPSHDRGRTEQNNRKRVQGESMRLKLEGTTDAAELHGQHVVATAV